MRWLNRLLGRPEQESLYFFTLHKAASSYFGRLVLRRIVDLERVDYSQEINQGRGTRIEFASHGKAYGPIRISAGLDSPEQKLLVSRVATEEFVRDKHALFFIRDPRDIMVSGYHSFGFSHRFSPVPEIRRTQEETRERIRAMGIDQYALASVQAAKRHFELIARLHSACPRSSVLRYEDMVDRWETFAAELGRHVQLQPAAWRRLHDETRPRVTIDPTQHRRDGSTGQFRKALRPETIEELNRVLGPELETFGYLP